MAATVRQTHEQWISAPLPPDKFIGPARVAWESAYPAMLGRYYTLLEGVTGVRAFQGGVRAVGDSGGAGVGSGRSGEVGGGGVQQGSGRGSVVGSTNKLDAGVVGGDAVGAGDAPVVSCVGCAGRSRQATDGAASDTGAGGAAGDGVLPVDGGAVRGSSPVGGNDGVVEKGKNNKKNRLKREKHRAEKQRWRNAADDGVEHGVDSAKSACAGSAAGSVQTVDTRTGVEIEAAQTLAARRVAENKLKILEAKAAAKLVEHRLRALNDKERTLVIDRLAAARLEEKINTSRKKSQDSFNGCASPIESVGSALSAHEFAFKQQVRKIEAQKEKIAYQELQVREFYRLATPDARQRVAEIPEPHIPTDAEMEAEDADQSPEPSDEEMEAEAAKYFS